MKCPNCSKEISSKEDDLLILDDCDKSTKKSSGCPYCQSEIRSEVVKTPTLNFRFIVRNKEKILQQQFELKSLVEKNINDEIFLSESSSILDWFDVPTLEEIDNMVEVPVKEVFVGDLTKSKEEINLESTSI